MARDQDLELVVDALDLISVERGVQLVRSGLV